ncbi:hypothetical protein L226DRAFT_531047 [Lentinus tigrinus ALCF2SS1-7]|uniref:DUF7928 domain-containing protein n=1 Tax=Lentinus tigrinus ALCF2SS1-6 TaxID=1328759 RepID=A0A5C2SQK1_9APHY|nr:hypothetical protein L227DRAFT_649489 [Lentinus tigrinus ALCF2SS1-6]RPD79221.1 hypothetical protein L226DRAFT_531047 [Lentinus tigrinus ALCF2SS1-7]
MDAFSFPTDQLFGQLSRLVDGDHSVFIRTDSQTFLEYHRGGKSSVFTSHVAALMPNVVIKLQTPLVPSVISSVQPQQGRPVQRDPHTRLYVADGLTDIIGLVKDHKAATLREDATLVSWSNTSLHEAFTSLFIVYKELHTLLTKYDPARAIDPVPFFGDGLFDNSLGMDCFDQFIHNYEPSTTVGGKPQDFSTFLPAARRTLPPLGTLESVNSIDSLFSSAFRASYVSSRSASGVQSPMLGDSPTTYMSSSISRLCIDNTPLGSASMFSPAAMSYTFSSPSASSSSASDGMLSTPMTIAPSVLSSPNSWESTPFTDSPALPVILETPLEEHFDEESASHFLNGPELPESQPMISPVLPPSPREESAPMSVVDSPKRKRSSPAPAKEVPAAPKSPSKVRASAAEKPRSRAKTPKATASRPQKPLPAPKKVKAKPATPPAPKRGVCPLPGRVVKSSRRSTFASSSASEPIFAPKSPIANRRPLLLSNSLSSDEESEHEHIHDDCDSDCDDASEYEADRSSDDDEEFRPYKRTRSSSYVSLPSVDDSSRTRRKARTQKINAAMGLGSARRKSSSSSYSKRRKGKKELEPRTPCIFFHICEKDFSRHSDMVRHVNHSCTGNPNKLFAVCPVCDYVASRNDASIRHKGSEHCRQRLKAKLERLEQEEAEAEAAEAAEEDADMAIEAETAEAEAVDEQ